MDKSSELSKALQDAYRRPGVKIVNTGVVYENDDFVWEQGVKGSGFLRHVEAFASTRPIHVWVIVTMETGRGSTEEIFEVLTDFDPGLSADDLRAAAIREIARTKLPPLEGEDGHEKE